MAGSPSKLCPAQFTIHITKPTWDEVPISTSCSEGQHTVCGRFTLWYITFSPVTIRSKNAFPVRKWVKETQVAIRRSFFIYSKLIWNPTFPAAFRLLFDERWRFRLILAQLDCRCFLWTFLQLVKDINTLRDIDSICILSRISETTDDIRWRQMHPHFAYATAAALLLSNF